jgi:hypothetical protein
VAHGRFEHYCLTAPIITAMRAACSDPSLPGHEPARRIMKRQHFRMVADFNSADRDGEPMAASRLADRLAERFGSGKVRLDSYRPKSFAPVMFLSAQSMPHQGGEFRFCVRYCLCLRCFCLLHRISSL